MAVTYYAILTTLGAAKLANAAAIGTPLQITQMAVGDGNGNVPVPDANRTILVNEVRRAPLNRLSIDAGNAAQIIAEQVIPETVGGWWIREIGLLDNTGTLIAIANCAPSYKPLLAEGSGRTQTVRMVLIVNNTGAVELKIDPSVVLATREYVDTAIVTAMNRQDAKASVRVATTANITLNGLQAVDGVALMAGDRVLVKNQAAGSQNGIYVAAAGAWARSADADENAEVTPALTVSTETGTTLADTVWQLITDAPIVIGATALVFRDITNGLARTASPAFTGDPTAPTPARFDAGSSIASTGFVQRALGNFSSQNSVNTTRALALDNAGQIINCSGTITVTLPIGAAEAVGATFQFNNSGSGTVTVQAAVGQALFGIGNGTPRTFVLGPGDSVTIAYVGGGAWYGWGGVQLGASSVFASLLQGNGYQKLPGGLILQWGSMAAGPAPLTFAFPIAFPTAVFNVQVAASMPVNIGSASLTGVPITAAANGVGVYVFAIGK
jgi:phage-related tail fiber protein